MTHLLRSIKLMVLILSLAIGGISLLSGFTPLPGNKEQKVVASSITFKIKNAGFTVNGSFGAPDAHIAFDAANVAASAIEASVKVSAVNTGNNTRDSHLRGEKYFDAARYPLVLLKSKSITKLTNGSYSGVFALTIKGITKDVTIPFTYTPRYGTASLSGSFTINRRDFGVGASSMIMSDNVTVLVEASVAEQ